MTEDEELDIKTVLEGGLRSESGDAVLVHVEDNNALQAFYDGKYLFDVTTHGRKLSAFIDQHPEIRDSIRTGQTAAMLVNDRPVYFAVKNNSC